MTKTMPWAAGSAAPPLSATLLHFVAYVLRAAGDAASRLAVRVAEAPATPAGVVEFHALHREAGAPEGALYIDGKLVGTIKGVHRL